MAARRATVEEESTQLLADAKDVRKKADEYATSSRQKAQTEAEQIIEEAKTRAQELVDERREAAQEEIDGLNTRIAACKNVKHQLLLASMSCVQSLLMLSDQTCLTQRLLRLLSRVKINLKMPRAQMRAKARLNPLNL